MPWIVIASHISNPTLGVLRAENNSGAEEIFQMFSRIIYWSWSSSSQSQNVWYTMFLGYKPVHIQNTHGCCCSYVWSEWKTMRSGWITVCGAATASRVGEHQFTFFHGRACGTWHLGAIPSPASSAAGTQGGLEQAGGRRISGDPSGGGLRLVFLQIHFSGFVAPFSAQRQTQPCLALAAAARVAGKRKLHLGIRL